MKYSGKIEHTDAEGEMIQQAVSAPFVRLTVQVRRRLSANLLSHRPCQSVAH